MDAVLEYMKQKNIPLTRERYLNLAYFGNPPEKLTAEQEAELPEEFQEFHSEDGEPTDSEPAAGLDALRS